MAFAGISYAAILGAGLAAWLFGAAYYMALSRPWMAAAGLSGMIDGAGAQRPRPVSLILSLVGELVMALVLAGSVSHLGPGQVTVKNAVISALILWAGFIVTTTTIAHSYQRKPWMLTLIDNGHWLGVMLIMGLVIGGFGV